MPCFFCIAIGVAATAGLASAAAEGLENLRHALQNIARSDIRMTDDTPSTRRLEVDIAVPPLPGRRDKPGPAPAQVPVAITHYKKHDRIRIQVLTHDVDKREAEAVQDLVADALGLKIVHRATDHEQHRVHDAIDRIETAQTRGGAARPRDNPLTNG